MTMDLTFKELEPIYDVDYDDADRSWFLMSYFRELPNIKYPSFLSDKNSSLEYLRSKTSFVVLN